MYHIINYQNYRNLFELRIRKFPEDFSRMITIVRSRTNLSTGVTDYSMNTDCRIDSVNERGQLVIMTPNQVYFNFDDKGQKSRSDTHQYLSFLVYDDSDYESILDKKLIYVLLNQDFYLQGVKTSIPVDIPVFANSFEEAVEVIKSQMKAKFNFDHNLITHRIVNYQL